MTTETSIATEGPTPADSFQAKGFLTIAALAILVSLSLESAIPFAVAISIAILSVAVLGIPHGALDYMHLKRLATSTGRPALLGVGLLIYVLLALLVILAWAASPGFMLAAFLLATVAHWGVEDTRAPLSRDIDYLAEVLLRGAMPVMLPSVFHGEQTTWLFSQLVPADSAQTLTGILGSAWPLLVLLALLLAGRLAMRGAGALRSRLPTLTELAAVMLLFALTPPLIAFAVYFGLLHSARFMARYATSVHGRQWRPGLQALIKDALPMTLLTWVLALGALMLLWSNRTSAELSMQILFVGLAALTLPHALLVMSLRFFPSSRHP